MSERGERVAKIFKLADACNRCGTAFRVASDKVTDVAFRHYADELRQLLDRCIFELLTEVSRIEGGCPPRSYVETTYEADILKGRCETVLHETIRAYENIIDNHIPAHARAMIKRQAQLLKQMAARFHDLYRASA